MLALAQERPAGDEEEGKAHAPKPRLFEAAPQHDRTAAEVSANEEFFRNALMYALSSRD